MKRLIFLLALLAATSLRAATLYTTLTPSLSSNYYGPSSAILTLSVSGQPTWSATGGSTLTIIGSGLLTATTSSTGTLTLFGATPANVATATALATARAINGVNFDGSAAITVGVTAASVSGTLATVSVSGQPLWTMTAGSTFTFVGAGGVTLTTSSAGSLTILLGAASVSSLSNSGTLSVSGASTIGTLTATTVTLGALTATSVSNSGTESISGSLTLGSTLFGGGAASFASTLSASGAVTLGSTLVVASTTSLSTLSLSGAASFASTLSASAAVTFGSTLKVAGAATYSSAVSISGNLAPFGPLSWGTGLTVTTGATQISSTSHHILVANTTSATTFTLSPVAEAGREYIIFNKNTGVLSLSSSSGQATTILTPAGALTSSLSVASNSSGIRVISDGTWWLAK